MDLMLSLMDEGFHLGCAVAALMVITQSVYMGLTSVDQVTSVIQKCLLLHFHMVRLRPGSGVLLEIAVWVLDMAFHMWFLLVDCTRVLSSLYFSNKPMQILHCVLLFIFHLQILRRYCMGIHVTVENVVNPAEDAIDEAAVAQPAPVAPPVMVAGHDGSGVGGGGHEYEDSSIQGSLTLQDTSTSTSKLTSTANESFLTIPKPAPAGAWESCSCQRSASRDELSLGLGRPVDDSDGSVPACRCYGPRGERPSDGVSKLPSETNVSLPGPCTEIDILDQATVKSDGKCTGADEFTKAAVRRRVERIWASRVGVRTMTELKERILSAFDAITDNMREAAFRDYERRLHKCLQVRGGHVD
ncbi:hypothetical protein HPB47_020333 [Ixodes persulcatus]|uniref:Uncharacterized protein n=1 Tax=Ixodes persulcatus TaxID=34615 RepID=A0AC60QFS9_IXOPE|nr:hypothetical protein HPB47_020333 [Ixodes persulcatus]